MNVVVLMCNDNEFYKNELRRTITELRSNGNYHDDIVLLIGDDLLHKQDQLIDIVNNHKVIIKYFKTIDRSQYIQKFIEKPFKEGDKREITKSFQFHKFYIFDHYFKKWEKVLYIDAGMHIMKDIYKILNIHCNDKILVHSDGYPYFKNKLDSQFEKIEYSHLFNILKQHYNLNVNHFQTGIILFNTILLNIHKNIFNDLLHLSHQFYNTRTNEQAIMNLFFYNNWQQLPLNDNETHFYDIWERGKLRKHNYIMLKRFRFNYP